MLGMNIPSAMFQAIVNHEVGTWQALGYVVVVSLTVLAVRFVWSLINNIYDYKQKKEAKVADIRGAMITTLAGVRGAVTMAGVLTVPIFLASGEPFPLRSLIIFIAAGVILMLLILATVLLPLLCKKDSLSQNSGVEADLTWAKNRLLLTAIEKIKSETNEDNEIAAMELIEEYTLSFHRNLSAQSAYESGEFYQQKINEVRVLALNLERKYIKNLWDKGEIDTKVFAV